MTNDTPITAEQFETALYVLETLRAETPDTVARQELNEAHHTVQLEYEARDDPQDLTERPRVTTALTAQQIARGTPAASVFDAGYDLVDAAWVEAGLNLTWLDPEQVETDGGETIPVDTDEPVTKPHPSLDPSRYQRGDAVTLTYDSLSHSGSRITRRAVVWDARDHELELAVESFRPPPTGKNSVFTEIVDEDGDVYIHENRTKDDRYTRVHRGERAALDAGWSK